MAAPDKKLEKAILDTVAYFDIFAYPMTLIEIWKWLCFEEADGAGISLDKIKEVLDNSEKMKSLIDNKWGFYFFKNREQIVELRRERYNLAEEKFRKALRVARFLKLAPGLKMIGVCNSLAWGNASDESDIDLFIVTEKNKIWSARFWTVVFLKIFRLRPKKDKTKDKICLSFFVDEEHLNMESLAIQNQDIYLIYWINQVVPIFDKDGVYQKFLESNEWIKKFLPNVFNNEGSERRQVSKNSFSIRSGKQAKDGFAEKFLRGLQYKILPKKIKEIANQNSDVVIKDGILKFHRNDRRREYREKWLQKIKFL